MNGSERRGPSLGGLDSAKDDGNTGSIPLRQRLIPEIASAFDDLRGRVRPTVRRDLKHGRPEFAEEEIAEIAAKLAADPGNAITTAATWIYQCRHALSADQRAMLAARASSREEF